ncbi:TPA: LPD1 domain-containing protein, partial [Pseudomonas aeruginosa]
EVWFKQRLDSAQEQNDYLVADSKAATGGVYPTTEHMDRISVYADRWVSAIQAEMQVVNHNYLGQVSMPVLFSQQGAKSPMSRADLFELADAELTRLFGRMRPGLSVHEFADASAGYYDLAAHLLALNPGRADRGTFYHEAWHAAHATLLRTDEQLLLAEVFKPGTPLVDQLEAVLRDEGMYSALDDLSLGTLEIQAYAFQMWELGKFTFGNESGEGSFNRVDEFISGVECCADLLGGAQAAQRLFERFRSGELGVREPKVTLQQEMSLVDAEWDDGNLLVWNVQLESGAPSRPPSRGMQM